MKNIIIIIILTVTVVFNTNAQNNTLNTSFNSTVVYSNDSNKVEENTEKSGTLKTDWEDVARMAKPMQNNYTGYKVELLGSYEPLKASHAIYSQFGKVELEKTIEGAFSFYYLIGDFKDEAAAEKFMNQVIINRFPGARVVRYKKGQRKGKNAF